MTIDEKKYFRLKHHVFRWWFLFPISMITWLIGDVIKDIYSWIYQKVERFYDYLFNVSIPESSEWQNYRRTQISSLRPYLEGETLSDRVSISPADRDAGRPKKGDMIARNPKNHDDMWLVASDYFKDNFEKA